jgi:hypothetical protein
VQCILHFLGISVSPRITLILSFFWPDRVCHFLTLFHHYSQFTLAPLLFTFGLLAGSVTAVTAAANIDGIPEEYPNRIETTETKDPHARCQRHVKQKVRGTGPRWRHPRSQTQDEHLAAFGIRWEHVQPRPGPRPVTTERTSVG